MDCELDDSETPAAAPVAAESLPGSEQHTSDGSRISNALGSSTAQNAQTTSGNDEAAATSARAAPISYAPEGYQLAFEDTFEGTALNADNWTIGLRDPATGDLVPGAKGDRLLNHEPRSCSESV